MDDCQAKIAIAHPCSLPAIAFDHHQAPVDLLPPVHPGGVLLADKTTLGEADAIELGGIALQPKQVAEFGPTFANAKPQAMLEPAGCWLGGWGEPAEAQLS